MRTLVKTVLSATDKEAAEPVYKETVSFLDKMAHKGLIKANTAARRKARITRHLNTLK